MNASDEQTNEMKVLTSPTTRLVRIKSSDLAADGPDVVYRIPFDADAWEFLFGDVTGTQPQTK